MTPTEILEVIRLWLVYRPVRSAHKALRAARNKRRARLGKPLLPPLDEESAMQLFPDGTMTKTGAAGAVLTPIVVTLLHGVGIGECTPQVLAVTPTCVGATEIGGALLTIGFGIIAWMGRNRAERKHQAELVAVAETPAATGVPTAPQP